MKEKGFLKGLIRNQIIVLTTVFIMGLWVSVASSYYTYSPTKEFEGVTLRITTHTSIHADWLRIVIPEFERLTGIKVEIVEFPYDALTQKTMSVFLAGSDAYDLIETPGPAIPKFVPPGHIEKISPDMVKELELETDIPGIMGKLGKHEGEWYLAAFNANNYILAYRTDLFNNPVEKQAFKARYGYELRLPETWEQLMDIAKFFTRKKGEKLAGKTLDHDFYGYSHISQKGTRLNYVFLTRVHLFGAKTFDENMRVAFNNEQGIAAVQSFIDMFPYCPPGVKTYTWGDCFESLAQDLVAMCEQWPCVVPMAQNPEKSKVVGKVSLTSIPTKKGVPPIAYGGGWQYGVSKYSSHKEAAFELLKYVTSTETTIQAPLNDLQEPARFSGYTHPKLLKKYPHFKENLKILKGRVWITPLIPEYTHLADIGSAIISDTFQGKHTPKEAVDLIAKEWEKLLEEAGYYQ